METFSVKAGDVEHRWVLLDASGKILGRFASEVARRLRGKHRVEFCPHMDVGDFVVIVNVEKLVVTGNKRKSKLYYRHTGYPGGIKCLNFEDKQHKDPSSILEHAVKGMLPKGPLGYAMFKKLKTYVGPTHPHVAQNPTKIF